MAAPDPVFKPNDEVEGFRVLSEIGQGAASVIYLVQDPKTKQVWSLKHVHRADAKDDRFLQQAIGEYEVASRLNHPNLRQVVKMTKKRKGLIQQLTDVFLIMEYFDGRSMDIKPPQSFDDAIQIFEQTAAALNHMHERGFVHADMKPNNILVAPGKEGKPVAKVIDLGQSCKTGTIKPRIQGTPDYIAPEQVHRRPITHKTDIYNLGATMYWTLTRQPIPTALAKGDSLVSRIDDALMPKPKPAIELNERIPVRLNELVMQCVEVDPADRPLSMSFVIDRLELILGMVRAKNEQSGAGNGNSSSSVGMIFNGSGSSVLGVKVGGGEGPGTFRAGAT
jgi:serine/threonine-protein kinase